MKNPQRLRRYRTKGWKMPHGAKCVTRPGKWGNPFPRTAFFTSADAVAAYRRWLRGETCMGPGFPPTVEEIRRELGGKDLLCYCRIGDPCHADVLLDIANGGQL